MLSNEEDNNHSHHQLRILSKFKNRLEKEKFIHNQAGNYYMRSNRWFVIPGILITGSSSVISFLGASDFINVDTKMAFNITVGVLTAGAAILQSISTSVGFETRNVAFSKAADSYDNLITKIEFELCSPNEDFQEFCDNLEKEILKIKNDCKFLPPLFCHQLYEKEVHRVKKNKGNHINNSNLTSILINNPNLSNGIQELQLSTPNLSTRTKNNELLTKLNQAQFQDANEDIEVDKTKLLHLDNKHNKSKLENVRKDII